jgi:glycosyltransferase involved in cell wall biosynthesis
MQPRPLLTVFALHVIQYQAPLYAELALHPDLDLHVAFFSDKGAKPYFDSGFARRVQWDIDLLAGYHHSFVPRSASRRLLVVLAHVRRSDVILVHGHSAPWMLITTLMAILTRTPYLLRGDSWVEGKATGWRRTVRNAVVRLVVGRSAAGLANGIRNADFYSAFGCRDVVLAPYSVDIKRFRAGTNQARGGREGRLRALGLNPSLPTIISAGKLGPVKRPLDLVGALQWMKAEANLVFVGDGELASSVAEAARGQRVAMLGFVNQTDMPAALALGDIIALVSDVDQWGLVVNEAMACGLFPVVSNRVGCAPDLVEGVGETFPASDVVALAAALDRAVARLSDDAWRREAACRVDSRDVHATAAGYARAAFHAIRDHS